MAPTRSVSRLASEGGSQMTMSKCSVLRSNQAKASACTDA